MVLLACACALSACNSNSAKDDAATSAQLTGSPTSTGSIYTFKNVSKYILGPRCGSCHQFTNYSQVMRFVRAGDPENSALYYEVASGRMPKQGSALSDKYIHAIGMWIHEGARNN